MQQLIHNDRYSLYLHVGPPIETNAYLFIDEKTHHSLVIDPSLEAYEACVAQAASAGADLKFVINTHGHWDHVLDNHKFQTAGIPIWIHPLDEPMLGAQQSRFMGGGLSYTPSKASVRMNNGDTVKLDHFNFSVLHTPGHSQGSLCLYEQSEGLLFSGDTLFRGTYGRTDFPGGSVEQMEQSLKRLAALPLATQVFPGHGPLTRIEAESWAKNPQLL